MTQTEIVAYRHELGSLTQGITWNIDTTRKNYGRQTIAQMKEKVGWVKKEKGEDPEISISRKLLHPGQWILGGCNRAKADPIGSFWECGVATQQCHGRHRRKAKLTYPFPPSFSPFFPQPSAWQEPNQPVANGPERGEVSSEPPCLQFNTKQSKKAKATRGPRCPGVINKKNNFLSHF